MLGATGGVGVLEYGLPRQAADVFQDVMRAKSRDAQAWASLGIAELTANKLLAARNHYAMR